MVFRPISSVLADVMADLRSEIDGTATRGSNVRASGRSTAVKGVATDAGEGGTPVAFAQSGGRTPTAQTGMRKMAEPGSPAKLEVQEERQSEDNRGSQWSDRRLSNRKHTLTVLPAASASRHVSSARPTRCVGSHLKLVWSH